ncbi:MAG: SAM-dependent methyltransferase [Flavobacteriales bacterium]|nr:SAM-dependent methyltransferase [Flavobacteriales bacterium]MCB9197622.1 SAM-dependent methyltransferase [Flavobacteriales bacterium]
MMLSSEYWNNRYIGNETGWDIGHASPAIIAFFQNIDRSAKILIPGCGNAYEGEILHQMGFEKLHLMDFASETKKNFIERYLHFPKEQFIVGDFFELEGKYDYIVEQTFFCALTPTLRTAYAKKMHSLLAENGTLVGLMFDAPLNDDRPPFGGCKEDYKKLFSQHFNHVELVPCENSIVPRAGRELWIEIKK